MSNRILHAGLSIRSPSPCQAEIFLTVEPERLEGSEARGRLMGPRCQHASTVEVAYRFGHVPAPPGRLALRAFIPEASLWSPQAPHLYAGPVELWQDGQRLDSRPLRLGLRAFALGPRGLRCNGRLLVLRGRSVGRLDDDAALALRAEGIDLLVADVAQARVWEIADRVGFAVLGRAHGEIPAALAEHPSCLGWLLPDGAALPVLPPGTLFGTSPAHPLASQAHFIVGGGLDGKPVLALGDGPAPDGAPLLGNLLDG